MSDEMMKILQMLEEGKITAQEAHELLSAIGEGTQKTSPSDRQSFPGSQTFSIPPLPDISKIVNDALREAFSEVERELKGLGLADLGNTSTTQGAHFTGARLNNTNLTEAQMDSSTRFEGANLAGTNFADADLRGADLRGANLSYSNFADANLRNADLRGSSMSNSTFEDANFANADLRGANLSHGKYTDANFSDCDLQGANLSRSNLIDADFSGVHHRGLRLCGVELPGIRYHPASEAGTVATGEGEDEDSNARGDDDVTASGVSDTPRYSVPPQPTVSDEDAEEETIEPKTVWPWSPRRRRTRPSDPSSPAEANKT